MYHHIYFHYEQLSALQKRYNAQKNAVPQPAPTKVGRMAYGLMGAVSIALGVLSTASVVAVVGAAIWWAM